MSDKKNYTTDELIELVLQDCAEYFTNASTSDPLYGKMASWEANTYALKSALETLRNYE